MRVQHSIEQVPGEVELAVIAVPAAAVLAVARECAAQGVRALVVLSAGFRESGPEGAERERELLEICRDGGIRLIGPNCLGVLNTDPEHGFDATFAPGTPPPGDVGFVSQSGALGLALIDLAAATGVGVSSFASVGNRADITANDLLEFWEQDPRTRVALLYIESFSDPRRFARVARRVGRQMPVVAVKSGRSGSGARAAGSHTGALLAASDRATDALFEQSGVIRAETMAELLDVSALLSSQPLPRGPRVGILTNAGGPGIMCADACEATGLEVPELAEEVRAQLRGFLPSEAGLGNPVDMIATAGAEHYRRAIAALAGWDGIDALVVIFIRPLLTEAERRRRGDPRRRRGARARAADPGGLHVAGRPRRPARGGGGPDPPLSRGGGPRPRQGGPATCAGAERDPVAAPDLDGLRQVEAAAILAEALAAGREWLERGAVRAAARLLRDRRCPDPGSAADPQAAGVAAAAIGGAVALKAIGPGIVHKTEIGAVRLDLSGAEQVEAAAAEIDSALAARDLEREAFLVQEQIGDGVELLVGIATDPVFGPVLAVGAGGTAAELIGDVQLRICPIDGGDPAAMLAGLKLRPLLDGYRGGEPVDLAALEAVIARVGAIAGAHPEIAELDLNPVIATANAAIAADARVRVHASTAAPGPGRAPGTSHGSSDQPLIERVARQLGPGAEAELLLDMGPVGLDRADAEVELLADLAVGVAESHQAQDLGLAR